MQKITSYLYPNRIEAIANLGSFTVEFANVYQRNIKLYQGIDNKIEFDLKNADQKRLDLTTFKQIELNIMDVAGNALPNSPYTIEPTSSRGIGIVVIPEDDLVDLSEQYLKYSVTGLLDNTDVLFYTDTNFNGCGTIEVLGNAMPRFREPAVYTTFTSEVDYKGIPVWHSVAIPVKFTEAVKTATINLEIAVKGFVGTVWIDATDADTITNETYRKIGKPWGSWHQRTEDGLFTGVIPYGFNLNVENYSYLRVSFQSPGHSGAGANFIVTKDNEQYQVEVANTGTGYSNGTIIKVPGSQVGGVDGLNDLYITVIAIDSLRAGIASSYGMSAIANVSWTGTATTGPGHYRVSGSNYSGTVESITLL